MLRGDLRLQVRELRVDLRLLVPVTVTRECGRCGDEDEREQEQQPLGHTAPYWLSPRSVLGCVWPRSVRGRLRDPGRLGRIALVRRRIGLRDDRRLRRRG